MDSEDEGKSKRVEKNDAKKTFRLSFAPTICLWVSEDETRLVHKV